MNRARPVPGRSWWVDYVGAPQPERIRELVLAAGCQLVFLPAYSPDLSPIEEAFSKIKARIKAAAARTRAALDTAIASALNAVSAADAAGWSPTPATPPAKPPENRCEPSPRCPPAPLQTVPRVCDAMQPSSSPLGAMASASSGSVSSSGAPAAWAAACPGSSRHGPPGRFAKLVRRAWPQLVT